MTFELCVPAHNEAAIIRESLEKLRDTLGGTGLTWSIVVADNASTDGTSEAVVAFADERVRSLYIGQKGKGAALVRSAKESTADLFGFIDADLSADPADIPTLLAPLMSGDADVVVGSRLLDTRQVHRGVLRSASSRIFNAARRALLGIRVVDSQCGLKVMNRRARELLASCVETGWFLDLEFLARAERAGLRVQELPVRWEEDRFPGRKSKLRVVRDGIGALRAMVRIRARLFKTYA